MRGLLTLKAGDTVTLNDTGLKQVFGTTVGMSHLKTLKMKITFVSTESWTEPEKTFEVRVDNPEIDQFLIDNWCFDLVGSI